MVIFHSFLYVHQRVHGKPANVRWPVPNTPDTFGGKFGKQRGKMNIDET